MATGFLWGEERTGAGTVLLLHGWAADSSSMHSLVRPMRDLGFKVAAFDAPAHGAWDGDMATMTQYTRAVGAVMNTLGDVRVVIAHSLGAIAAVGAAAERKGAEVDCMVLMAPACTLGGVLDRWDGAGLRLSQSVVRGVYSELHQRNGVPVSHWDVVALGGSLDQPVLVVHDPDDSTVPYSDGEAVAAGLSNVLLVRAPGTGHLGILMSRDAIATVSAFVAGQTCGRRSTEGIA
ncbi:alpha/beta hydrolase [Streptomyces sp. NPDC021098]|uniref:alpha/beta hydrolase n=1 Tax=unclassified Streptomyces TaxID=2593676 RepID=UPI00378CFA49